MKCADPVLCYTKSSGKKIYRNFSFLKKNTLYLQNAQQVFDCGKCLFCRKKKAYELALRCVLHSSLYQENCFLTLTYDEKRKGYHNDFAYEDIQKFKKKLRNLYRVFYTDIASKKKKAYYLRKIKIFNVHEYGKNGKKHWHGVVFNHDFKDKRLHTMSNGIPLYKSDTLSNVWKRGFCTTGDVSEASAMYTAQYMEKDFKHRNEGTSKKSQSRHSGIGRPYFEKHYKQLLSLGYVPFGDEKIPLPRYFEKLALKHWCHFNQPSAFHATNLRGPLFRPFDWKGDNKPNEEISRLFEQYKKAKQEKILDLEKQWNDVISLYLTTDEDPDFIKSATNALYDLRNKTKQERF